MTGTARGCEDEFKRFFGIKVKAVPLHKESKRGLLPIRFFETREAALVAVAGKRGAVTVATDMADRGTDISIDKDVKQLGGLFVFVSEPHKADRVDRQLIGRCARQ